MRDAYRAMAAGDGRALGNILTADTTWVIAGHGTLAGVYTGPEEIFGLWKRIAEQTGGGLRLDVEDVFANDTRAVVLVRAMGNRGTRQLAERQVAIFELVNRKVETARFIYEDPDAYDSFWAD